MIPASEVARRSCDHDQSWVSQYQPGVCLCMIVKDEAANLPISLGSVRDLVSEIVVGDTGSSDKTREVAMSFGARVIEVLWTDSFAGARNEVLRYSNRRWVFSMDADDAVDSANHERLRRLFSSLGECKVAYAIRVRSSAPMGLPNRDTSVLQIRLFPNDNNICWEGRVHESVAHSIVVLGFPIQTTDIEILHRGYANHDVLRRKMERNLTLLQRENAECPGRSLILFYLGWTYLGLAQAHVAIPHLEEAIARSTGGEDFLPKTYALLAGAHCNMGKGDLALLVCQRGLLRYPFDRGLQTLHAGLLAVSSGCPSMQDRCSDVWLPGNGGAAGFNSCEQMHTPATIGEDAAAVSSTKAIASIGVPTGASQLGATAAPQPEPATVGSEEEIARPVQAWVVPGWAPTLPRWKVFLPSGGGRLLRFLVATAVGAVLAASLSWHSGGATPVWLAVMIAAISGFSASWSP